LDERIAKHIIPWLSGKKTGPYEVEFRITRTCNLKCFHCPGYDEKLMTSNLLPLKSWLKIIQDCEKMGIKECLVFAEGEPMSSKMALPMMNEIKKLGMRGKTATNGTLFTKESAENLVKISWDQIYISLDAPDAKSHDYVRGKGVFDKVIKNMKIINATKKKFGKQLPEFLFNTVLTNLNYNKLDKIICLAHELNVSTVCFHPLNLWTKEAEKLKINSKQTAIMQKQIPNAIKLCKKYEINNNLNVYLDKGWIEDSRKKKTEVRKNPQKKASSKEEKENPFFRLACYLPWYFISINEDGRVNPCHSIRNNKENIHDKPLQEIWFGKYFKNIRDQLLKNKVPLDCSATCCAMQATEHQEFRELLLKAYNEKDNEK